MHVGQVMTVSGMLTAVSVNCVGAKAADLAILLLLKLCFIAINQLLNPHLELLHDGTTVRSHTCPALLNRSGVDPSWGAQPH